MTNVRAQGAGKGLDSLLHSVSSNSLILTVLILLGTIFLSRFMRRLLDRIAEKKPGRRIQIKNFIPLLNILLYTVSLYIILFSVLEFSKDVLMTLGVSAGVAVGLAAQGVLANIFSGLVIVFTRLFNIGDKIQVGEDYGEVVGVSLTNVKIVTPDDSVISIPSKKFLNTAVSNANSGVLDCQVVVEMLLPGDIDIQAVEQAALEAAWSSPAIYMEKGVAVVFRDEYRNASLVRMKVKAYVADHRQEFRLSSDIYRRVKKWLLEEAKINPSFFLPGREL